MRFDVEVKQMSRRIAQRNIKTGSVDLVDKEIDFIVVETKGDPDMIDIASIIDELYIDIVDFLMCKDELGIIINPNTTNIETIVYEDTILECIAEQLNAHYFSKYGFGLMDKPKR